ncbi:lactococcin 972 family bacteriocin [Streptomyces sp. NBC_01431]|uniref:lactococcin 972 family bacteriocin n=1 Tax=Streptomyces sp. NBC_01431 TaxID=2903863 RepID=UPI002E376E86|nr:lactococcin 972 family bacteriocin [Streptomyces sp. NBC_01431]
MKITFRSVVVAIAGATLAAVGFAAPATADGSQVSASDAASTPGVTVTIHHRGDGTQPPAELGNPSEWGVAKIEIKASAHSSLLGAGNTCQNVAHGQWCYGWDPITPIGMKRCYSNYLADVSHKTTVRVQNEDYSSGWVSAGSVSYASVDVGTAYTCYAYYDNA